MINCVEEAYKAGKITKKLADQLADADNIDEAIDIVTMNLARQKREAAIQAMKVTDAWTKVTSHPKGVYYGLRALLSRDMTEKAGYQNIDKLSEYYVGKYHGMFAEAIEAFRTKNFGVTQDKKAIEMFIRALYGEVVDDVEIMKFAKQWKEVSEEIRLEFNAKGGSISKNDNWILPQKHDSRALLNVSPEDWIAFVKPKLNRTLMTDDLGNVLSDAELDDALKFAYESITTNGLNKVKDFTVPKLGKKLSRRGSEKRFLYFDKAEDWMEYNKEFGAGDIFTTLTDHLESKANDIAVLDIMGPSPESTFSTLFGMAEKKGLSDGEKTWLNNLWATTSGKINGGDLAIAGDIGAVTSNVMVFSTLGAAFVSAMGDIGFQFLAAKHADIPILKVYGQMIKNLNPANKADRMMAARLNLGLEEFTGLATAANRFADVTGTGRTGKIADFIMRASFLNQWTGAGRSAFGKVYAAEIASEVGKPFSSLSKERLRAFKTYGITEQDWNAFRKQPLIEYKGVKHIDVTQEGGKKFHQMISSDRDMAVPTADANTRAVTTLGSQRNSIGGVTTRAITSLKSFPITILQTHGYRMANMEGMDRIQYAATLMAVTTLTGAMALQLKDIVSGRTPRDTGFESGDKELMAKFWFASMMQGGALGIAGDFAFADQNRFGGGPIETAFGPKGEMISKALKLTFGNAAQLVKGEDTNFVEETIQTGKRYLPDTWQVRLLTDAMMDQLTIMADPKFEVKMRRQMRKREQDLGSTHYWKKGEFLPEALK